ncbi:hypothetical protein PTKIN_Ptkin17bG0055000 [Pterospermum kingtungense]
MTPQALTAAWSFMYAQQPFSSLQQQALHSQLDMSSGGSAGLHMLQSEASTAGGSVALGTGGFPHFGHGSSGEGMHVGRAVAGGSKQDIESAGSADGHGGGSGGQGGDGGETLYLKTLYFSGNKLASAHWIVMVDEYSRTNIPSIWAVGAVTNRMNLTPVALMEGTCFAKTIFGSESSKPDYSYTPCAVFSIPTLSVVGLSEKQAIEQANGDVLVFTSTFNPMKNTISGRQEKTVMKLVLDAETDKVLGASMCGPDAHEIMQRILES